MITAVQDATLPYSWESPNGEDILWVDIKAEWVPNYRRIVFPRGTESIYYPNAGYISFHKGGNPRIHVQPKIEVNRYYQRIYPGWGISVTGFELWFPEGSRFSSFVELGV